VLADEANAARRIGGPRLVDALPDECQRLIPRGGLEPVVPPDHGTAITIRIVETLQRGLTPRA
jgi:hypothetical protein